MARGLAVEEGALGLAAAPEQPQENVVMAVETAIGLPVMGAAVRGRDGTFQDAGQGSPSPGPKPARIEIRGSHV